MTNGYGYLPDEGADLATLEAELRNYLDPPRPQPPIAGAEYARPTAPAGISLQWPEPAPAPQRDYLSEAAAAAVNVAGPHLTQAARNMLELSPIAAIRDYQQAGEQVGHRALAGDIGGAALGIPVAAMALMGIGNPAGRAAMGGARAASAGKKAWEAPSLGEAGAEGYPRTFHGTPHEFDPVRVVRDAETGDVLHVAKAGEEIPRDRPWANRPVEIEEHPHGRFDWSKMGTGEGAQAYGHGHYSAEARGVAEDYRKRLSGRNEGNRIDLPDGTTVPVGGPYDIGFEAQRYLVDAKGDFEGAIKSMKDDARTYRERFGEEIPSAQRYDQMAEYLKGLQSKGAKLRAPGVTYESALKAKPEEMLDWDAPFGQQSKLAHQALVDLPEGAGDISEAIEVYKRAMEKPVSGRRSAEVRNAVYQKRIKELESLRMAAENKTGQQLWYDLVREHGDPETAAMALRESGIKAIRYKDQMSRQDIAPLYKGARDPEIDAEHGYFSQGVHEVLRQMRQNEATTPETAIANVKRNVADLIGQTKQVVAEPRDEKSKAFYQEMLSNAEDRLAELNKINPDDFSRPRGTYNYVALDDDTIEILAKYGIAGLIGGGAAAGAAQDFLGAADVSETPTGA